MRRKSELWSNTTGREEEGGVSRRWRYVPLFSSPKCIAEVAELEFRCSDPYGKGIEDAARSLIALNGTSMKRQTYKLAP